MTKGSNRLPTLAAEIKLAHEECRSAVKLSVDKALEAGEALVEAKSLLGHGQWLPWLKSECELSERTAQRYMRLAKNKDLLATKSDTVSDLTIREALSLLDTRSELERALALEGEQEALRRELPELSEAIATSTIEELVWIIERATDIERQLQLNRIRALHEIGRLMKEVEYANTG